jgi:hypothetical protein
MCMCPSIKEKKREKREREKSDTRKYESPLSLRTFYHTTTCFASPNQNERMKFFFILTYMKKE